MSDKTSNKTQTAPIKTQRRRAPRPVAYMHVIKMDVGQTKRRLTFSAESPFGVPGRDHSATFKVVTTPLYPGEFAP